MKQEELEEGKWYSLYPYHSGDEKICQWWMKAKDKQGRASAYISWFKPAGQRVFCEADGNLPGHEFTEATPHEVAWLTEVQKRNVYFPIEEFDSVVNNYPIY